MTQPNPFARADVVRLKINPTLSLKVESTTPTGCLVSYTDEDGVFRCRTHFHGDLERPPRPIMPAVAAALAGAYRS